MIRKDDNLRSNEEWLAALGGGEAQRDAALEDLRRILVTGLKRGVARSVRRGREFDELVEDFAQEALLNVMDKLETFRGESRFETWAQKIAVHIALTELRRKRWADVPLESVLAEDGGSPMLFADPDAGPVESFTRNELVRQVLELIRRELTERQRMALTALMVGGMPMEEVARRMDTNRNALYKLLHDARKRLKRSLAEHGMTPEDVLAAVQRRQTS